MDWADDLDAFVVDELELDTAEFAMEPPPDADRANLMLRALRGLERRSREIEDVADAEMARITRWRDDRQAGIDKRHAALTTALEQYARAVQRLEPKRKTIKLPHGELKLRAGRERVVVTQEEVLMQWLATRLSDATSLFLRLYAGGLLLTPPNSNAGGLGSKLKIELVKKELRALVTTGTPNRVGDDKVAACFTRDGDEVPGLQVAVRAEDDFSIS